MRKSIIISSLTLLLFFSSSLTVTQGKRPLSDKSIAGLNRDGELVEVVIPLKNMNSYYCYESDDNIIWLPDFKKEMENRLIPLFSKGGSFEFRRNHSVRVKAPRENVEAIRIFFEEQEKKMPDATEEDRKAGVTKSCN